MAEKKILGFIGTGVMGKNMVLHLFCDEDQITVYNRTLAKAMPLAQQGATVASSVEEAVRDADFIFTIVGFPQDVEEVYSTIFMAAKPGAIAIDMTTSSAELAQRLHEEGRQHGIRVLDAPVSGGDSGAAAGRLDSFAQIFFATGKLQTTAITKINKKYPSTCDSAPAKPVRLRSLNENSARSTTHASEMLSARKMIKPVKTINMV